MNVNVLFHMKQVIYIFNAILKRTIIKYWINSNNLCLQYMGSYKIQFLILLNSTTFLRTYMYEMLLNSYPMSPSFFTFFSKENIQDWSHWISLYYLLSLVALNHWQSCGRALATWENRASWSMSMSKTELDTLHAITYFVLEFERQERVNWKTNISRPRLRGANTGSGKYLHSALHTEKADLKEGKCRLEESRRHTQRSF